MKLEEIYKESQKSEKKFCYKKVLFIGSESYDAPTITIIEGLQKLGFKIFTIKKLNINSWFCNKIIESPKGMKFDFILSNLHWGTRWSYYEKYNLLSDLKVLIDGDDNISKKNWKKKFEYYKKIYTYNPPEEIKMKKIAPYRWVEEIGNYKPDIIFTSQKQFGDKTSFYLPFGIHQEYFNLFENKHTKEREIDFCHIGGPGIKRKKMKYLIKILNFLKILPGKVYNNQIKGNAIIPKQIKTFFEADKIFNYVHGYNRWVMWSGYFKILNNSKVLIYPGIDKYPFWDSKRPWEAYASGCLVLMSKPNIDVSEYPITEICEFAVYNSYTELIKKCRYLYKNQSFLDKLRKQSFERAKKYFTSKPLANYFLMQIKKHV